MPGTLMFEGCLQAMAVYLAALGHTLERDGLALRAGAGRDLPAALLGRRRRPPASWSTRSSSRRSWPGPCRRSTPTWSHGRRREGLPLPAHGPAPGAGLAGGRGHDSAASRRSQTAGPRGAGRPAEALGRRLDEAAVPPAPGAGPRTRSASCTAPSTARGALLLRPGPRTCSCPGSRRSRASWHAPCRHRGRGRVRRTGGRLVLRGQRHPTMPWVRAEALLQPCGWLALASGVPLDAEQALSFRNSTAPARRCGRCAPATGPSARACGSATCPARPASGCCRSTSPPGSATSRSRSCGPGSASSPRRLLAAQVGLLTGAEGAAWPILPHRRAGRAGAAHWPGRPAGAGAAVALLSMLGTG